MGSTTRRRGVYGGEYTPTGLRLFAWWKKNGERRLQKAGSGSAGIRSYQTQRRCGAFYKRPNRSILAKQFCLFFPIGHVPLCVKYKMVKNHLVYVLAAASCDQSDRSGPGVHATTAWPASGLGTKPNRACKRFSERAREPPPGRIDR
jgi:hypothetical protein